MRFKEIAIISIFILILVLTAQNVRAKWECPTHIDINDHTICQDIFLRPGESTELKAELWFFENGKNKMGTRTNLCVSVSDIEFNNNVLNATIKTNDWGNAYIRLGSTLTPGKCYNITFKYLGNENLYTPWLPSENSMLLHVLGNSNLVVNNITVFPASVSNVSAKLTDLNGVPLVNRKIDFKINNIGRGTAITNSNGIATLPCDIHCFNGTMNLEANFAGDDLYKLNVGNEIITINNSSTLTVKNITWVQGITDLTAKLTDHNGMSIKNKNIMFYVSNGSAGSVVTIGPVLTNSQGIALVPYNITQKGTNEVGAILRVII